MAVNTLKIYEIISSSLPEEQAKSVTKAIEEAIEVDWISKKEKSIVILTMIFKGFIAIH